MYTLGFPFRPWRGDKSIAGGAAIRDYIEETAREYGIDRRIRFRHRIVSASWSSAEASWTLEVEAEGGGALHLRLPVPVRGYYRLRPGLSPGPGRARRIIAAASSIRSSGPSDLDYAGKRVVVIGSGATAVTLVPAMAETGGACDDAAALAELRRVPARARRSPTRCGGLRARCLRATRWKNVLLGMVFFSLRAAAGRKVRAKHPRAGPPEPAGRLRRRARISAPPTIRGTSASASSPTATCSRRSERQGGDRHRPDRALHRDRAPR